MSTKAVEFAVEFPAAYSSTCIISIECYKCSRFDTHCETFFDDRAAKMSEVGSYCAMWCPLIIININRSLILTHLMKHLLRLRSNINVNTVHHL
jgi:hypothetical protein